MLAAFDPRYNNLENMLVLGPSVIKVSRQQLGSFFNQLVIIPDSLLLGDERVLNGDHNTLLIDQQAPFHHLFGVVEILANILYNKSTRL